MDNSDDGDRLLLLHQPSSSDELSSFLRQIMSRTPTSHQPLSLPDTANQTQPPATTRIVSTGEIFDPNFSSFSGEPVSSAGDSVPEVSQYQCAFENKRNGGGQVQGRQRSSLKRNLDAQFHNLSEKRRRSKINEKMKALQKLIPNSNKTDKASMLEEAIEYLKQLQLQVQTLAVMNGLGLNPMRLPPTTTTQTRLNEQDLNLETLFHGSHSMPAPEVTRAM